MQRNILEYLESDIEQYYDKIAFKGNASELTFGALYSAARSIGTYLAGRYHAQAIPVIMEKTPQMVAAFLGVLYSGNFYVPMDKEMSAGRIAGIIKDLGAQVLIADSKSAKWIGACGETELAECAILPYDDICSASVDETALASVRRDCIDTDLAYLVFTSGSTGKPKAVAANHRNVIDYIDALSDILGVTDQTIYGSQTPFYVDACLKEVYTTLKRKATTYIIPKSLFSFPVPLVECIVKNNINTVCWVVSALTVVSSLGALVQSIPYTLTTVAFGSEVFPAAQFEAWRRALPEARFINLYGATEATGMQIYYDVPRERVFADADKIPIGKPFPNIRAFLVSDVGQVITEPGIRGEIYLAGSALSAGYYDDEEKTAAKFVQNPVQPHFREFVYRTGDIAVYDGDGNMTVVARADYQIKHMGYRIELPEIEQKANAVPNVALSCCVYDAQRDAIGLYYTGSVDEAQMRKELEKNLPRYMVPQKIICLETLPLTNNGKIDRVALRKCLVSDKRQ